MLQKTHTYKTVKTLGIILGAYLLLLLMDYSTDHQHTGTLCLFKIITGIPCPGCGMGRATLSLFKGDIFGSISYNILCIPITIAIAISFCWLVGDLIRGRDTFFKIINQPIRAIYLISFFLITAISWAVNIIRGI